MEEQTQSPPVTPTEAQPVSQQPLAPHRGVVVPVAVLFAVNWAYVIFCNG